MPLTTLNPKDPKINLCGFCAFVVKLDNPKILDPICPNCGSKRHGIFKTYQKKILYPLIILLVLASLFSGCMSTGVREVFRSALGVDTATWVRGRGWALSVGLIALTYYRGTNPVLAGIAQYTIDEVLADFNEVR